jgi:hypothetical protein
MSSFTSSSSEGGDDNANGKDTTPAAGPATQTREELFTFINRVAILFESGKINLGTTITPLLKTLIEAIVVERDADKTASAMADLHKEINTRDEMGNTPLMLAIAQVR